VYKRQATSVHGTLKKNEREWVIDHNTMTTIDIEGSGGWIQVEIGGGETVPEVDRIDVGGRIRVDYDKANGWEFKVLGSDDGQSWEELGRTSGRDCIGEEFRWFFRRPGRTPFRMFMQSIALKTPANNLFYRVEFKAPNVLNWSVGGMDLFHKDETVEITPSHTFTSVWMSEGTGEEWVYVDLGAICNFDKISLHWIRKAAAGSVQVSDDGSVWEDLQDLPGGEGLTDEFIFEPSLKGRYVRILMNEPVTDEGYLLSEIEVYGKGGPVASPKPSPAIKDHIRMDLAGGAWKLQRESLVDTDGESLSKTGFQDDDWVVATVPATVLVSYWNAGALPDPNFGDNQLMKNSMKHVTAMV